MAPLRGISLILVAFTILTFMSAFVKAASETVPTGQVVFFRAFLSLPIIAGWLWARGELRSGLYVGNLRSHVVRGVVGTVSMGLGFGSLAILPLAEAQAIRFATPVFLVVFAALILGERFRLIRLGAVAAGLAGVLVIVAPRFGTSDMSGLALLGAGMALTSAGLAALAQVIIKAMSGTERSEAIAFYFLATAAVGALFTLPFGWVWPTPYEALLLAGCGLFGAVGQMFLTASYQYADASALAPFSYISMIWATLIGFVWFGEVPDWPIYAGAALIIGSGIAIVLREHQLNRAETARRKLRAKGMM
ncbi:EamA domain-containing membrane protein RarD [Palleronia aestuarii]|uniref:EamA domain-containing membrane protein RarD n=1 Tax=Palleronia aestuarii TaxID=568105 RepID=A0A2W7MVI3_9RHOB|nr:DMT family transporter [Palleronia aestuarii]PZX11840.1 EamA domain-containing membrane protein RarD [Palleronia aestuarii]